MKEEMKVLVIIKKWYSWDFPLPFGLQKYFDWQIIVSGQATVMFVIMFVIMFLTHLWVLVQVASK